MSEVTRDPRGAGKSAGANGLLTAIVTVAVLAFGQDLNPALTAALMGLAGTASQSAGSFARNVRHDMGEEEFKKQPRLLLRFFSSSAG